MKENQAEKTFERSKQKKYTFQKNNNKFDFKKSFDQNKPKKQRYYSTKIIINFVPQIKPKKSFCKPTFFQLNKDENNNENDRSFELDKISSYDEIDDNESIEYNESSSLPHNLFHETLETGMLVPSVQRVSSGARTTAPARIGE
jgi:hypothetical protein